MARSLIFAVLLPGVVSFSVAWLLRQAVLRRVLPRKSGFHCDAALPLGVAFLVGFCGLPDFGGFVPQRHWQWLVWLVPLASLLGGLRLAPGIPAWERTLLSAAIAATSAWLLVPLWPDLRPSPFFWRIFLGFSMFAQIVFLDLVESFHDRIGIDEARGDPRYSAPSSRAAIDMLLFLMVTALVVAGVVAAAVSISYGRVACITGSALAGIWIKRIRDSGAGDLRQILPAYVVAVAGMAFVGCVEPRQMLWGLLLAPWAPLAWGLAEYTRRRGWTARSNRWLAAASFGFVLGISVAITAWSLRPVAIPTLSEEDFPF